MDKIKLLLQNNTRDDVFTQQVKDNILYIITTYQYHTNDSPPEIKEQVAVFKKHFIHIDQSNLLPIPVLSNTSPSNSIHFMIHIILSEGHFETEIDAMIHPLFRDCLRAVGSIWSDTDQESLKTYV